MSITRHSLLNTSITVVTMAVMLVFSVSCKKTPEPPLAKRVLVIAFDGICTEGLLLANTPNIDYLSSIGASSMTTRNEIPPITLTNFTTILTGVGPALHGVDTNLWTKDEHHLDPAETDPDGYFPSVFKVLKENVPDIKTAFFWNWGPLIRPFNPKYFDDTFMGEKEEVFDNLYDRAMAFLLSNKHSPCFAFLYSVHTDAAGHNYGWLSDEYMQALEEGDVQIGRMIDFLKENGMFEDTHILFVTDHGGYGCHHGNVSPKEMIVPWIIEGPGIRKDYTIAETNLNVNTSPTIVRLFGIPQPGLWTGKVPESIFAEGTRRPSSRD